MHEWAYGGKTSSRTPAGIDGCQRPANQTAIEYSLSRHCSLQVSVNFRGLHCHVCSHVYAIVPSQQPQFPRVFTACFFFSLDPESLATSTESVWRPREAPPPSRLAALASLYPGAGREWL
jgi:hypothetical protein